MKRQLILFALLLITGLNLISFHSHSQAPGLKKEGEVVYDASTSSIAGMGGMSMQLDIVFKNDKMVTTMEVSTPAGKMTTKNFIEPKESKTHSFMNMSGHKYEVELSKDESKQAMQSSAMGAILNPDSMKFNFKAIDSTIKVLGHTCRKYTGHNSTMHLDVYACDSIYIPTGATNIVPGSSAGLDMFQGINGGVLKYVVTMNAMGIDIIYSAIATKLSYAPVNNSEFKYPKGYKKVTYEQFQDDIKKDYMNSN